MVSAAGSSSPIAASAQSPKPSPLNKSGSSSDVKRSDVTGQAGSWVVTAAVIFAWYASNIGLLLLNKLLLSTYDFRYPIFLTALHMLSCSVLSIAAVSANMFNLQRLQSRAQLTKVASIAFVFCASLVLGNTSLRYIPVSFNQAVGSTTPAFTAVISVIMTRKVETRNVYLSLIPVVLGIVIASGFEPSFHLFGFLCCLIATALRALKSVVQGILLSDASEKLNSLNLLMYMAPMALGFLIPLMLVMEDNPIDKALVLGTRDQTFMALLLLNAFLAYFVNLLNFMVTKYTSALTLQVLGNAKGVVAAAVSVAIFKNLLSVMGCAGYALTIAGVFCYSEVKRRQKGPGSNVHANDPEKQPLIKP